VSGWRPEPGEQVIVTDAFGEDHEATAESGVERGRDFLIVWVRFPGRAGDKPIPWPFTDVRAASTAAAEPLFGVDAPPRVPELKLSQQRRSTMRKADALRNGQHPLGIATRTALRLHPDAPPADDRDAPGPRCGGCRFRQLVTHHGATYPKCVRGLPDGAPMDRAPYATHGSATDVRSWWPACEHWEPNP
jgi:hypothetical protein